MAINGSQFAIAQVGANAFAGAASGFAAGGIMGGNLNSALQGAVSGTLSGGTAGCFGDNYNLARVAAESVAGGASSAISGGSFRDGFKVSGVLSALTYASVEMRDFELEHSRRSPGQVGDDPGVRGRSGKLAGNRIVERDLAAIQDEFPGLSREQQIELYRKRFAGSLMGCHQGGQGCFFGISYPDNSVGNAMRFINESFAGAHDFASHPVFYRSNGMSRSYSGLPEHVSEAYSWMAVVPSMPFAVSSMIPDSIRWVLSRGFAR